MEKGDKVMHRQTRRMGLVHSFSKKYPGWIKVQWEGDESTYRYEPDELLCINAIQKEFDEINQRMTPEVQREIEDDIREKIKKKRDRIPWVIK